MLHTARLALIIALAMVSSITAFAAGDSASVPTKKFTWGAEAGTGIDMGGDNMSTLNLRATIAYSGPYLELAGIGAGVDMVMSNSTRSFPLYAVVRSSFSRSPRLLFAELRGGIAVSQVPSMADQTKPFIQPGIGIHLATGASFSSYLTLSYTYNGLSYYGDKADSFIRGINLATIAIGITF